MAFGKINKNSISQEDHIEKKEIKSQQTYSRHPINQENERPQSPGRQQKERNKNTFSDYDSNYEKEENHAAHSFTNDESIIERVAFEMEIEDIFEIDFAGANVVVTGRISTGCIYTGENINISAATGPEYTARIEGIEMFRKLLDRAEEGDNVGLFLSGVNKSELRRGMIASHTLHMVKEEEEPSESCSITPESLFIREIKHQAKRYGVAPASLPSDVIRAVADKCWLDYSEARRIAISL